MPTGKVKFFDAERGFGFITGDDGHQVFLHTTALPTDAPAPKPGARVEYGVADGRKGPQALSVRYLDPPPSVVRATRKPADEMAVVVEDVIKLLDAVGNQLRRGRYPDKASATKTANVLRAIADSLEA
ncbi:cold-shock protein [Jonesia denitrificans]|uniref:Cold-shock DNA-binding domain protein n=1 Tax=Jonesia denitrificans (strain ATCC 14870 / DSM 20603 / BCRC 15368 / CIP 55.134 / JCM 11481 / NBRC 15587 / NCTC 10816 / Prevot 55134) TaxID=471856 RepID=C7R0M1_JONDD|nr:cold shock domain-containing protein [Jonesia denitrificans]ACV09685.1 cold-shock DNA-binding domain protein [Jonesia denitrificans DSM 20603]ASE09099.1 cold shock domain-containing protein [Jonesia denitrificans]QXB43643.1 cold shock domain-containing protein [Jonesia denitrificans]SQH22219.1 Cold shock-like protein [Jonesia denitrificans]